MYQSKVFLGYLFIHMTAIIKKWEKNQEKYLYTRGTYIRKLSGVCKGHECPVWMLLFWQLALEKNASSGSECKDHNLEKQKFPHFMFISRAFNYLCNVAVGSDVFLYAVTQLEYPAKNHQARSSRGNIRVLVKVKVRLKDISSEALSQKIYIWLHFKAPKCRYL